MTADSTPPAADPIGRELIRHAQLISQLRRDLDELASGTTDLAADLMSRLEHLSGGDTTRTATRPWCWRDLGPKAEEELRSQLTDWVSWLRSRYPLAKKIPPCWAKHPEIVEELTALWLAWQHAYAEAEGPLTAAADWHDRWLPGLVQRLERGPHAINCSSSGHTTRPASAYARTEEATLSTAQRNQFEDELSGDREAGRHLG